jgi:hypothetical protein
MAISRWIARKSARCRVRPNKSHRTPNSPRISSCEMTFPTRTSSRHRARLTPCICAHIICVDERDALDRSIGNHVSPIETVTVIKQDPDDDRVLECVLTAKSDFIVTEDKDLLRVGRFGNSRIVTIGEFVKLPLTEQK